MNLSESFPAKRVCRYSDCVNALPDLSNVCPHHDGVDYDCPCGPTHDESLDDDRCRCWITCNECREFCGLDPLMDEDFPTTVKVVA